MLRSRITAMAAGGCLALALAAPAQAATGTQIRTSLQKGAAWLKTQQGADGNVAGFGGNTSFSAFAAARNHPADVFRPASGQTPAGTNAQDALLNSLRSAAFTAPSNPSTDTAGRVGQFQRSILEAEASGIDSARVASNQNLLAQLAGYYNGGYFNIANRAGTPERRSLNYATFGTLALTRAGAPGFLLDRQVRTIRDNQHTDGGWNFPLSITDTARAGASDVDMTGATLAALCEAGVSRNDEAVRAGLGFVESKLNANGSLGSFPNVSTNAWVVSGLNKCGVSPQAPEFTSDTGRTLIDFMLTQQNADGGFNPGYVATSDVYATQDALRPLGGEAFSATPPARANASNPRQRALPTVADGVSVPVALAVDDGSGGVTFCRVTVPSGSSLAAVLATANGSSSPAGCATGGEFTAGQLSKLNGQSGTWAFSVDGGAEQVAAGQSVRFGDLVALRRTGGGTPSAPAGALPGGVSSSAVPAAVQAKTAATRVASRSLRVSSRKRVASVSLTCAKDNRLCQGVVYLVYGKRTLARRAFLIRGGKTTKLSVKLSKRSFERLGGKKRRVKVNVFSRDGAGIASTSNRTVTLTPAK